MKTKEATKGRRKRKYNPEKYRKKGWNANIGNERINTYVNKNNS
jgi:hypothetical protein